MRTELGSVDEAVTDNLHGAQSVQYWKSLQGVNHVQQRGRREAGGAWLWCKLKAFRGSESDGKAETRFLSLPESRHRHGDEHRSWLSKSHVITA